MPKTNALIRITARITLIDLCEEIHGECWIVDGWNSGDGYAKISFLGRSWMVHRLLYSIYFGGIPEGFVLDHTCRQRACCNPGHLEAVTHQINIHRGTAVLFN